MKKKNYLFLIATVLCISIVSCVNSPETSTQKQSNTDSINYPTDAKEELKLTVKTISDTIKENFSHPKSKPYSYALN